MASHLLLGLCGFLLLCAAVDSQNAYDGSVRGPGVGGTFQHSASRGQHVYTDEQGTTYVHQKKGGGSDYSGQHEGAASGPQLIGSPGNQVYIRGRNDGVYTVPGVRGTFQYSSSGGDPANNYLSQQGAGGSSTHSISGPGIVAHNSQRADRDNAAYGSSSQGQRRARSPQSGVYVSRPGHTVVLGNDGSFLAHRQARSPQFHVSRPDRTVDVGSDGSFLAQRRVRSPQYHVSRPDRTVDYSNGNFAVQRQARSPHHVDGHDAHDEHKRVRRARVQGQNFVARDDQAGVWNNNVSVWKRPDGRTVTVDAQGNVITSGTELQLKLFDGAM